MWSPYLERLSERFDVLAPDHPGFGLSPVLAEVDSMSMLVEHYLSLLDGLGLDNVSVVGASFGGWLAAEIASMRDRSTALRRRRPPGRRSRTLRRPTCRR